MSIEHILYIGFVFAAGYLVGVIYAGHLIFKTGGIFQRAWIGGKRWAERQQKIEAGIIHEEMHGK